MTDKIYYVMGLFDEETNEKIRLIHENLSLHHIPSSSLLPHLTFGGWSNIDEVELCEWLEEKCRNQSPIELNFNHVGLFSLKVAFLAPQVSDQLLKFHQEIHQRFEDHCGEMGYNYTVKSHNWVPHVTIVFDEADNVLKSLPIINDNFKPFIGKITSLYLCEYNSMEEIKTFHLK